MGQTLPAPTCYGGREFAPSSMSDHFIDTFCDDVGIAAAPVNTVVAVPTGLRGW
jgi:hypothetical protein